MILENDLAKQRVTGTIDPAGHTLHIAVCGNELAARWLCEELLTRKNAPAFGVEWRDQPRVVAVDAGPEVRDLFDCYSARITWKIPLPLTGRWEAFGLEATTP